MTGIVYYDSNGDHLDYFTQWDSNRTIIIRGIETSPPPVFHLAPACSETAYVVLGEINGDEVAVPVPNILLQQDKPIILYAYYEYEDGTSKTDHTIVIPVIPRPRPHDYTFSENIDYISLVQLEADVKKLKSDVNTQLSWYEF